MLEPWLVRSLFTLPRSVMTPRARELPQPSLASLSSIPMTLTCWLPPNILASKERTSLAKPHKSNTRNRSRNGSWKRPRHRLCPFREIANRTFRRHGLGFFSPKGPERRCHGRSVRLLESAFPFQIGKEAAANTGCELLLHVLAPFVTRDLVSEGVA